MISTHKHVLAGRLSVNPRYSFAFHKNLLSGVTLFKQPTKNVSNGQLSYKSAGRLRRACDWMLFFSELKTVYRGKGKGKFTFRMNFITLTLSTKQQHTDRYILHHMLFPFIKWLERKWKVTAYVWRAEIQEKRLATRKERCIHFHIATSAFVHYLSARQKWNQLQLAHGYREKDTDPNSTDIHRVREHDDIVRYMQKYITKPVKKKELAVECKIFGMSRNLSQMKIFLREEDLNDYHDIVHDFLLENCTDKQETDHGMMYLHSLSQKSFFPPYLRECIWELKELYTKGITAETKYYL